jgi:hypothetical protein
LEDVLTAPTRDYKSGANGGTRMARTKVVKCLGALISAATFFASPVAALAGEQTLEFKLVTKAMDAKSVQAPNIEGRVLSAANFFGVAYFKDGRVAVKDFVGTADLLKGMGSLKGYSTYTFEGGDTLVLSYVAESKETGLHGDYTVISGTGAYSNATGAGAFDSVPTKWTDGATLFNVKIDVKTP